MIVMGVNRLLEVRDYWSRDEKLHNTFIASRISRDRFKEISRYLHFINNTTLPARDEPGYYRLQKVLPVISEMKQRFLETLNIQYLYNTVLVQYSTCTIHNTVYMYTVHGVLCMYTCQVTDMYIYM